MKNRKFILISILSLLTAAFCLLAVACNKTSGEGGTSTPSSVEQSSSQGGDTSVELTLSTDEKLIPTNLSVDKLGKATWTRVSGATGYELDVNGTLESVKFANYDVLTFGNLPADGKFSIKVRTLTETVYSEWGESVSYEYSGGAIVTPSVEGIVQNKLVWTRPTYTKYEGIAEPKPILTVAGQQVALSDDAVSYDISSAGSGAVSLYYKADGVYYKDSKQVKLTYNASNKKLAFSAPENVYMDGDFLRFDEVVGANIYYLMDVYNTVTSISGSDILALSSDRDRHFLIKAIRAGNTDLDIDDSDYSSVTYFTDEQGTGTAADPYMISSSQQLRFIEYYEAMGESKYYKLANDIEFVDYTPADDEDYSNFYNLGSLSGVIDGDGHSLKNIVVYYKDGYSSIFDSITANGVIKNLVIENTKWRTWTNRTNDGIMHEKGGDCAVLAYTNNGKIENVVLKSGRVVAAKDGAGGLTSINHGSIINCVAEEEFTVFGANEAGAFAAYNAGTIKNCINYGYVSGKSTVGGIVGRNAGLVSECGNEGAVVGDIYTGGIVGYNYNVYDGVETQYNTLVYACYNVGSVACTAYTGGIVGRNGSDGYNETATDAYANAGVIGCYNQGAVSGIISVGGIAGQNYGYDQTDGEKTFGIKASYNSGDVNYNVDGFETGHLYFSVSGCWWAEVDSPDFYAYFREEGKSNESAAKLKKVKIGNADFYSVTMPSYKVAEVRFTRVDSNFGTEYNSTSPISAFGKSTLIYYVYSDFSGASLVEPGAGALIGYNNMVNDCYYVAGQTVGGTSIRLSATIGGTSDTAYAKTREQMRGIAPDLNAALGKELFTANGNKYPILKWQAKEE